MKYNLLLLPLTFFLFGFTEVKSPVQQRMTELLTPVFSEPKVKSYLEKLPLSEIQNQVVLLQRKGMARLNISEIEKWNALRRKLADVSPEDCAGFWSGRMNHDSHMAALGKLSKKELDQWIQILASSVRSEVEQKPFPIVSTFDFQNGLKVITKSMTMADQQRLTSVFQQGDKASDVDGCWAIKTVMKVDNLKGKVREKYLQYLSSL